MEKRAGMCKPGEEVSGETEGGRGLSKRDKERQRKRGDEGDEAGVVKGRRREEKREEGDERGKERRAGMKRQ